MDKFEITCFAPENRDAWLEKEAKKLVVGDRIEFRCCTTAYYIDDDIDQPDAEYTWDAATIVEIKPPAPEATIVKVRYDDGRERVESMARRWRRFSN